eukprot:gene25248-biopygen13508
MRTGRGPDAVRSIVFEETNAVRPIVFEETDAVRPIVFEETDADRTRTGPGQSRLSLWDARVTWDPPGLPREARCGARRRRPNRRCRGKRLRARPGRDWPISFQKKGILPSAAKGPPAALPVGVPLPKEMHRQRRTPPLRRLFAPIHSCPAGQPGCRCSPGCPAGLPGTVGQRGPSHKARSGYGTAGGSATPGCRAAATGPPPAATHLHLECVRCGAHTVLRRCQFLAASPQRRRQGGAKSAQRARNERQGPCRVRQRWLGACHELPSAAATDRVWLGAFLFVPHPGQNARGPAVSLRQVGVGVRGRA